MISGITLLLRPANSRIICRWEQAATHAHRITRRMIGDCPLISVVVPAFNASQTIRETLRTISQQTYLNLEVIVVDDGSTDGTAALVQEHSLRDPRFRLISQMNGGVASARNAGVSASSGEFIAFIDADDLWHPSKLEKQIAALVSAGRDVALVYCAFRSIDVDGKVVASPLGYAISGWVLHRHFHTNLVGNGSAILIRKSVLQEIGGFDVSLRAQGAEGCEDLLLQLRVAARYRFGQVPEYLVGYRRHPESMSSNTDQMVRSGILAVSKAFAECHDVPLLSASAMLRRYEWKRLKCLVKQRTYGGCLRYAIRLFQHSPLFVVGVIAEDFAALSKKLYDTVMDPMLRRLRPPPNEARHFYDFDPADIAMANGDDVPSDLRRLSQRDQAYRPKIGQPVATSEQGASLAAATPAHGIPDSV
jgi:glycosyltransferase involved in cell wall biosynthesis